MEISFVRTVFFFIAKAALIALAFSFIAVKQAFAISYTISFEDSKPINLTALCSDQSGCRNIGECWNSERPGVTGCGQACVVDGVAKGSAWTKYSYDNCYETREDARTRESTSCTSLYTKTSAVYSTADKCSNGQDPPNPREPYLNSGNCSGTIGGRYKTCCTNDTPSLVSRSSCVAVTPYSSAPYPPYDGVCPAGTTGKFCGFGGYPACGQSACGSLLA